MSRAVLSAVVLLGGASAASDVRFLVVGDFGEHGKADQTPVAVSMGRVAESFAPDWVLSTGDNVYDKGITGVDDPLWKANFQDVYTDAALDVPWFGVLGNHDWHGNVSAQWDGAALGFPRWRADMSFLDASDPRAVTHHGDGLLDVFYIDTRPYDKNTQEMVDNDFLPQAVADNKEALALWWDAWREGQVARLEEQLAVSQAKWKIVTGHYGIYSYGKTHGSTKAMADINGVLRRGGAALYINGHDHVLQNIRIPGDDEAGPVYVTSGGGSYPYNDITDPEDGSLLFGYGLAGFHSVKVEQDSLTIKTYNIGGEVLDTLVKQWVPAPQCDVDPEDFRCKVPIPPAVPRTDFV